MAAWVREGFLVWRKRPSCCVHQLLLTHTRSFFQLPELEQTLMFMTVTCKWPAFCPCLFSLQQCTKKKKRKKSSTTKKQLSFCICMCCFEMLEGTRNRIERRKKKCEGLTALLWSPTWKFSTPNSEYLGWTRNVQRMRLLETSTDAL